MHKEHDATQRRVTELYGQAADQLGSDKAPVRLAGLYALERLAQDYESQRQTIVNVVCAYLRMPFEPTKEDPETPQELQVRLTAQRVLVLHLRQGPNRDLGSFWPNIDLDLSGAELVNFGLAHCTLRSAVFYAAVFHDVAAFRNTTFAGKADFKRARFTGKVDFRNVAFEGSGAFFAETTFENEVDFGDKTVARLNGAIVRTEYGQRRKWPRGWAERPISGRAGYADLVTGPMGTAEADRLPPIPATD